MRSYAILFVIVSGLSACTMQEQMTDADAKCANVTSSTTDQATCYDQVEAPVWAVWDRSTFDQYQAFSAKRLALAREIDQHQITLAEYQSQIAAALAQFNQGVLQIRTQEQANDEALARASLQALSAYEQARANADAAAARSIQQHMPTTQQTTCNSVFGQLQCTTTTQQ